MYQVKLRRADGKPFYGRKRVLTVNFQAPGLLARKYHKPCREWSDLDEDEAAGRWTLEYTNVEAGVNLTFDFEMGEGYDRTFEQLELSYWEDQDGDTTITDVVEFAAEVIRK